MKLGKKTDRIRLVTLSGVRGTYLGDVKRAALIVIGGWEYAAEGRRWLSDNRDAFHHSTLSHWPPLLQYNRTDLFIVDSSEWRFLANSALLQQFARLYIFRTSVTRDAQALEDFSTFHARREPRLLLDSFEKASLHHLRRNWTTFGHLVLVVLAEHRLFLLVYSRKHLFIIN